MKRLAFTVSLLLAAAMMSGCSNGCGSASTAAETTAPAADSQQPDTSETDETTEPETAPPATETADTSFRAADADTVSEADLDTMTELCGLVCRGWGKLYNGKKSDISQHIEYDALNTYLTVTADIHVVNSVSDSSSSYFEVTSAEYDGRYATLHGVYKDNDGAYGRFIFIIGNSGGVLLVNDMLYDTEGTVDLMLRPEAVSTPSPDFFADSALYEPLIAQAEELRSQQNGT